MAMTLCNAMLAKSPATVGSVGTGWSRIAGIARATSGYTSPSGAARNKSRAISSATPDANAVSVGRASDRNVGTIESGDSSVSAKS